MATLSHTHSNTFTHKYQHQHIHAACRPTPPKRFRCAALRAACARFREIRSVVVDGTLAEMRRAPAPSIGIRFVRSVVRRVARVLSISRARSPFGADNIDPLADCCFRIIINAPVRIHFANTRPVRNLHKFNVHVHIPEIRQSPFVSLCVQRQPKTSQRNSECGIRFRVCVFHASVCIFSGAFCTRMCACVNDRSEINPME